MSMDLNFWRYQAGAAHDDALVYQRACCDGDAVETLEPLPIPDILAAIAKTFRRWTAVDSCTYENKRQGSFQIFTTPQIVRFDCYDMTGDSMNALIDLMGEFGCPLYDPQVSTRFDGWTDR